MANYTTRTSNKNQLIALILCIFFGYLGAHQYYVGKVRTGILYTFTMGLCGFGWIIDAFLIFFGKFRDNTGALLQGNIAMQRNHQEQNYYIPPAPTSTRIYTQDYDSMDGHQFEYFCAEILRRNHFMHVEVTQGSGDHGIDILAQKDGITYAIQCKCYSSNIGNAAIQQAHTGKSLYRKDIAVVMTNRYFTAQAKDEAQSLGVKLWDRDKLDEMISNQQIGIL